MALLHEFKKQGDFLFRYRGTLPLLIMLPALVICICNEVCYADQASSLAEIIPWIALGVSIIGFAVRIHTIAHVPPNTSGRNTDKGQLADTLNKSGMYSQVRHPLYVGNFLMWAGPAMLTQNIWFFLFFVAAFWLYYERIMYAEEAFLRTSFGDIYDDWSHGIPAFIPRFKGYINSKTSFSWKKVLKQEKNGFAALFIVFWIFDVVPDMFSQGMEAFEWNFWSIAALSSTLIYLFLKSQKRSDWLKEAGR